MNKEILNEVVEFTHELLKTPTCCQELKDVANEWLNAIGDVANEWLNAIGSENEKVMTEKYVAELKEDIMPIENLIAFAESKAGQDYFGEETAKGIVVHSKEIQAQGALYCDCLACAIVEKILKKCG